MTTQATLTVGASDDAIAVLCFIDGELEGREVTLAESVVVGRDEGCDLSLPASAKQSSSTHAIIRQVGSGRRMIKDLGSKNGTFVNDLRLERGAKALESGDLIQFGEGGPTARYIVRTAEARYQPRRPTMGYGITLARAEGGERLEWRDKIMISIGRDADADFAFMDPAHANVSSRHARLRYTGRGFQIQDLSKNGTFVNGERVESIELEVGDVIELGPAGPKLVVEAIDIPGQVRGVDVDEMHSKLEQIAGQSRRRSVLIAGAIALLLIGGGLGLRELVRAPEVEPSSAPLDAAKDFQALEQRVRPSTLLVYSRFRVMLRGDEGELVELNGGDSFGTAFFISTDGYAITNRHVVEPWRTPDYAPMIAEIRGDPENAGKIELVSELAVWRADAEVRRQDRSLIFDNGYTTHINHDLEVVGFPPDMFTTQEFDGVEVEVIGPNYADLALLRVEGVELDPESIAPLLADTETETVHSLTEVMNIGFPHGDVALEGTRATPSVSVGSVKKVEENLQLDISVYPGNSGSPVWDRAGRVICVTTRRRGERYSDCLPARMIRALIDHVGVDVALPGGDP